jgi:sarcosine oxidase, subunit gamma
MPDREQTESQLRPLRLTRLDGIACGVLRIRNPSSDDLAKLGDVLGQSFPSLPNTVSGRNPSIFAVAPNEWFIASDAALDSVTDSIAGVLKSRTFHFADVSDGRSVFSIAGGMALELLARGCSLDLHARAFAVDRCAQTLFAQIPALLHLHSGEPDFCLYVDASYEAYLQAWFARAVRNLEVL